MIMEKTRLLRKRFKELDGKIINSIFDLKAKYVSDVTDTNGNNLKFNYDNINEYLIIFEDKNAIYVHYQEK